MDAAVEARILSEMRAGRETPATAPETAPFAAAPYFEPATHALELERVFRDAWIPVARASALRDPGSYATFELAGDRLVALRGDDLELRVLHNVCRHRGAQILREACGTTRRLRCAYHGFVYALDGRLESVPSPESFPERLRPGRAALPHAAHALWGGWVWVHLGAHPARLADSLGPDLLDELAHWPLGDTEVVDTLDLTPSFDWKIGVEAFLEPLHVPAIHPRSAHPVVDYRGLALRELGLHSRMALPFRDPRTFEAEGVLGAAAREAGVELFARLNRAQRQAHFVYLLFPSTVLMLFPHHYLMLSFLPAETGPGTCRLHYELHALPQSSETARAFVASFAPGYRKLLEEDLENLPWIQRGVRDRSFAGVDVGGYETRILWFRRALAGRLA